MSMRQMSRPSATSLDATISRMPSCYDGPCGPGSPRRCPGPELTPRIGNNPYCPGSARGAPTDPFLPGRRLTPRQISNVPNGTPCWTDVGTALPLSARGPSPNGYPQPSGALTPVPPVPPREHVPAGFRSFQPPQQMPLQDAWRPQLNMMCGLQQPFMQDPGQEVVVISDASSCDMALDLQGDTVIVKAPESQSKMQSTHDFHDTMQIQVLWKKTGQPVCPPKPCPLNFDKLKDFRCEYKDGARKEIRDTCLVKVMVASLPATQNFDVRLQCVGTEGRTRFNEKEAGVVVATCTLDYTLTGEGNLEIEKQPGRQNLWLVGCFQLVGLVQCSIQATVPPNGQPGVQMLVPQR